MKNDFLDDDWLKDELSDDYIDDDDFSVSVVKKITFHERKSKRNFYFLLAALLTITSFLLIPDLIMLFTEGASSLEGLVSFSLFDSVNGHKNSSFMQMEFIGLCVILLSFVMIWSCEDFDLI